MRNFNSIDFPHFLFHFAIGFLNVKSFRPDNCPILNSRVNAPFSRRHISLFRINAETFFTTSMRAHSLGRNATHLLAAMAIMTALLLALRPRAPKEGASAP